MRAYQVMLGAIQKLRVFCVDGTTSGDDDSEDDAEAGDRAPAVRPQQRGPAADPSFSKIVALKAALASPDYRGERVLVLTAFKRAVNELKILLAPLGRPLFVYTGDLSANAREDVKSSGESGGERLGAAEGLERRSAKASSSEHTSVSAALAEGSDDRAHFSCAPLTLALPL
jgi:hypothetical protein